jgi:hypothetical protein
MLTFINEFPPFTHFLKSKNQNGAMMRLPTKQYMPNFHAFSRSRVRAYTLLIKNIMYREDKV